ncbi:MAG TPA: tetraacyldisaccharide 4'-kinase [Roseiarcus sp.]|nr:tetraacyldisaccharide 4'-kinase [Roseiarcus sp.]
MKAPRFWLRARPGPLARVLSPLGAIYGAATARRMARPGVRVEAPVLCVGNFVVGGAGKTPTALALARALRAAGERPAFLSRGYGGQARADSLRVSLRADDARRVGDEPLLLARVAPCYVGRDRVASARLAIEDGASVLIMDDGLQNPELEKTLSAAVVDGEAPFGNGLCLPAGPLRAPVAAQMRHVDALVMIGADAAAAIRLAERAPQKPLFLASLKADAIVASQLIGRPVLAFAGIANPGKFFATLAGIGAQVVETAAFPDHWAFRPREMERLAARAARRGLTLVCTEKDLVRLPPAFAEEAQALPVTLSFEAPAAVAAWLTGLRG